MVLCIRYIENQSVKDQPNIPPQPAIKVFVVFSIFTFNLLDFSSENQ